MTIINFKAIAFLDEINVNTIAIHFGINHKFKWEESLTLDEVALKGIVRDPRDKSIFVFPFGSIVFINCQYHEIMDITDYLSHIEKNLEQISYYLDFSDDYKVEISPNEILKIYNDNLVTAYDLNFQKEIVSTVLAKSVALERIEFQIDKLIDEIEEIINYLQKGNLTVSDKKLAKMSARILDFRLRVISYIMLLDKPEITWVNEEAENLFDKLSTLFELNDRCENIRQKSEMMMDITQVFSELAHARRGSRLEYAVIFLITLEIIISIILNFVK
ncbi:hypothetical protein Desaci_2683 [Desulfosporosinus acidiphilus SJ4]|uniref:DUF155 domain-containing protein n=1 Tax=Desulfosporosinus acidiphilus (strain DSM 22704 / JCM 16185 / SJ4) TaxID=646529 RepID=I4D741_DESAJ|nr:RMD1 family protein [Desulfosporosinus acidiphilus]AFM41615.1 hypothetical protein Desaci_2683 [Desulfosporosinus acidiphilus SJ4]